MNVDIGDVTETRNMARLRLGARSKAKIKLPMVKIHCLSQLVAKQLTQTKPHEKITKK